MAENKGLMFQRVVLRTEGNIYEGRCRLLDLGRVFPSGIEVRGSNQRLVMPQIGRSTWSPLSGIPSFLPKKYNQRTVLEQSPKWTGKHCNCIGLHVNFFYRETGEGQFHSVLIGWINVDKMLIKVVRSIDFMSRFWIQSKYWHTSQTAQLKSRLPSSRW